jgi:type IX secretion system PorP/SprF family membrane protein
MKTATQKAAVLIAIGCVCSQLSFAQDIHFSQFDETPLQLNPANAGVHHDVRIITNYKNQWQSVGSPYKTFALSADFRLLKKKQKAQMGLGIDIFSDKAGDSQMGTNQGNITLSGIIPLNDKSLISAGLMSGFSQRSLQGNNLQWGNQYNGMAYDATISSGEPVIASHTFIDLGAGIQYSFGTNEMYISANDSRKVNIGVAMYHPHRPAYSLFGDNSQRLHTKYVLHGDAALGVKNSNLVIKPSYLILLQGAVTEVTPGVTLQYILQEGSKYTGNKKPSAFSLGGYYRMKDAFIACAKFEYSNYAIGFSYDINLSKLKTVTDARGGFEISLRFISPGAFSGTRRSAKFY